MKEKIAFLMPRVIAWEVTRRCPLKCRHCRAGAANVPYSHELTTEECQRVLDSISRGNPTGRAPMIIWTGGEPMLRDDIIELITHATGCGIDSVMAPCGMLVTEERLRALKDAGVRACSFSLDGPDAGSHDSFRGVPGAYENVTRAMKIARTIGMPFQVNTTVSTLNINMLDAIHDKAVELGASKLDLFFLVPVGRGKGIADYALSTEQTIEVLDWAFMKDAEGPLSVKETCCPSAPRYWGEWKKKHCDDSCVALSPAKRPPCGCLGGRGFAFLSHVGDLQTCGFIDVPCGNIRDFDCDFPSLIASAVNPLGHAGNCRGVG